VRKIISARGDHKSKAFGLNGSTAHEGKNQKVSGIGEEGGLTRERREVSS